VATIVCGIDDSAGARQALRVAHTLSTEFDVRLVLAHVADGWARSSDESVTTNQGRQGGRRLLEHAAREHNLEAERRVEVGEPAEELARIAAEEAAILIVLGSRRQGWRRSTLRSGIANDIIRRAEAEAFASARRRSASSTCGER
jgi:nucleotide-binding universal stress UspA family protein